MTAILNKRVLLAAGVIVAMSAAALGATYAAWTASSTITGNTVGTANVSLTSAGTANGTSVAAPVVVDNILPGYVGRQEDGEFRTLVTNNGTVPLNVFMYVTGADPITCASTKIAYQASLPNSATIYNGYFPYSQLVNPEVPQFHFLSAVTQGTPLPIVNNLAPGATVAVRTVAALATNADNSLQNTTCGWSQVYYGETI
ncbi:MAG TPA: hypothetical protein PKD95_04875 [Candidatus Paceibacterota bacterium]|nr:hypothetical protein [Candidatus Paceibacterota bacterium]